MADTGTASKTARPVWVPEAPYDKNARIVFRLPRSSGVGLPLAPPGWEWGVQGCRKSESGKYWKDRYLNPTPEFVARYGGKRGRMRSMVELKEYMKLYHPTVSFEAVKKSFIWRVPAPKGVNNKK